MKFYRLFHLCLVFALMLGAAMPVLAQSNSPEATIASVWASAPPSLDGSIGFGEWTNTNQIPFSHGFITVANDNVRLYILIDALGDNVEDTAGSADFFYVTFDKNKDGAITPNVDLNYSTVPSTGNIRYQYYLGAAKWTGLQPNTFSSRAAGFGCFFADGTLTFSLFPFRVNCNQHRAWELAIDLDEIGATPGGSVKVGFRVASSNPSFSDNTPSNFITNFSNLHTINLASGALPAANSSATISLDAKAIELTQAIQDRDNTLPIVRDKTTVARVYVDTNGVASAQPAKVYLYGSQDGIDLPGSPLAKLHTAPVTINRSNTNNTANFWLPGSWDQGTVQFSSIVRDLFGNQDASGSFNKTFSTRDVPVYWIVPINTGTNASPVLVSDSVISDQESYLEAIYPVRDVQFVRKNWQVIGPTTVANTINALNQYYTNTLIAWFITVLFTQNQPFQLPDQIYGMTPSGGGISDPVWLGANGRVARGFLGTSLEGTMAHEINHNLDRDATGTWGRHVPNGCGATGPDSAWPYANDDIQEVGFDTRGSGKALAATYPDIMSYCQSGGTPTKWISPYRWNALSNVFSIPLMLEDAVEQNAATNVLYVTGQVNEDGSGTLNPVLNQPGLPSLSESQGDYSVEVLDANGSLLYSQSFQAQFIEIEPGEKITTINFNYQFPANESARRVVLKHNDQILDEIVASANPPTVTITSPNGGETWSAGVHTIQWTASDPDDDPLTFNILYSNDSGASWFPVAAGISGNSYEVDTSILPGSSQARIKVIASDGFYNAEDTSEANFVVEDNPPVVQVIAPTNGTISPLGAPLQLIGDATDVEDEELPEEAFIWSEGSDILGIGREVSATFSPGPHTLTLTVVDSAGNVGQNEVEVFIGVRIFLPTLIKNQP